MNQTVDYDSDLDIFIVKFEGLITLETSINAKKECLGHEKWRHGMNVLVDFRETVFTNLGVTDFRENAIFNRMNEDKFGHGRVAYLVSSDSGFGSARQFETFMAMYTKHATSVFRDETAARAWLVSARG